MFPVSHMFQEFRQHTYIRRRTGGILATIFYLRFIKVDMSQLQLNCQSFDVTKTEPNCNSATDAADSELTYDSTIENRCRLVPDENSIFFKEFQKIMYE